jgi:hypothetical protein
MKYLKKEPVSILKLPDTILKLSLSILKLSVPMLKLSITIPRTQDSVFGSELFAVASFWMVYPTRNASPPRLRSSERTFIEVTFT